MSYLATSLASASASAQDLDPFPSTYRPGPTGDLFFHNATILDGFGRRVDGGDLLLHNGKVAAIGRDLTPPTGAAIVDGHGRWLTPGIIDPHSHDGTYVLPLADIDREASDVSELSDPNVADTWVETAVDTQDVAFARALAHGVTTMQVLPGSSPIFSGRSVILHPIRANTVAAMKVPDAPQGFKMACGENPKEQDVESHRGPTSRQGEIAYIQHAFALAAREVDHPHDGNHAHRGRDHGGMLAHEDDPKRAALADILAGRIRINMHCYRAEDMATMLSVAHEFGFQIASFHHAVEAYKIRPLLKQAGVCLAVWSDWWGYKREALDAIRANAALLDRDDICVAMHSDSPNEGQRLPIEAAKAAAAGRQIGIVIPPERLIRWVTSNPARLLGLDSRMGALAPGMDADIVLWSGNPFSVYTKADLVVIDGTTAFDRSDPDGGPHSDFELGRTPVAP